MDKAQVVKALKEIADLLEIVGASRFEFSAFRNAASALDDWRGDLLQAVADNQVTDIPTVGKGTGKVIADLVLHGESEALSGVRGQVPPQLPELLRFRGLGPKKVQVLWRELNIESPGDLEVAIQNGSVASLKGFGAKSIDSMLASIEYFKSAADAAPADNRSIDIPVAQAASGALLAGTSGYSYPAWKGSFYPEKVKTAELLKHYAQQLPTVEINNTFYRFPSEKVVDQWKTQTPGYFQFALKAHRRVTHQMRLNENAKIRIVEFVERCSVLQSRLGCILFQLPPDFERDDTRLNNLLSSLPAGPRYAIEFRHNSWFEKPVMQSLTDHNIALVSGDSESIKPRRIITADFVYVRLRKTEYAQKELDSWQNWFDEIQQSEKDVLLYLKHDETGAAPLEVKSRWVA
ncbi:MAG: DUF72 domain-containing protein [Pseudomonadota bacterium]